MKHLLLFFITVYQSIISPLLKQVLGIPQSCRYAVTCSVYAKHVISTQGVLRGSVQAIRRILHCQPFIKTYA